MFFGIYNLKTGYLRTSLIVPTVETAKLALEDGEGVIQSSYELDTSRHRVDVTTDPHSLIDYSPAPTQNELLIEINRERTRRIEAGKIIDGIYLTGRDEDIRNLTNLALAAQLRIMTNDSSTTIYRDGNNIDHELAPTQILNLWQKSSVYISSLYASSWALKAKVPIPNNISSDEFWP
jgi:hypothetical protein